MTSQLSKQLSELFIPEELTKIANRLQFSRRKSKLTPEIFLKMCTFLNKDLCNDSLQDICSTLSSEEGISISAEGLNERFNDYAVEFMRYIFNEILKKQNSILANKKRSLNTNFRRIKIVDSTSFKLPKEFKEHFKGNGTDSGIKIQLGYDFITGQFINCSLSDASENDQLYLPTLQEDILPNDLCLKDLGYFKIKDLRSIDENKAFYISKLKCNINVYTKKNLDNGKNEYSLLDIPSLMDGIDEGQSIELEEVYVGNKEKLKSRLIVTKLSEESKEKKADTHRKESVRGRRKINENSQKWTAFNAYITNIPSKILDSLEIHELYSLRWQIEIMFKIWKSIFKIHWVKKVKLQRFQCCLYGKLIALLLSSAISFTIRDIVDKKHNKEISEIKTFNIIKNYFNKIKEKISKGKSTITRLLNEILSTVLRLGIKSKKKGKKTSLIILKGIKFDINELEKLVS